MKFDHKCCVCRLALDVSEIAAVDNDLVFCEVCYDKAKLNELTKEQEDYTLLRKDE